MFAIDRRDEIGYRGLSREKDQKNSGQAAGHGGGEGIPNRPAEQFHESAECEEDCGRQEQDHPPRERIGARRRGEQDEQSRRGQRDGQRQIRSEKENQAEQDKQKIDEQRRIQARHVVKEITERDGQPTARPRRERQERVTPEIQQDVGGDGTAEKHHIEKRETRQPQRARQKRTAQSRP